MKSLIYGIYKVNILYSESRMMFLASRNRMGRYYSKGTKLQIRKE